MGSQNWESSVKLTWSLPELFKRAIMSSLELLSESHDGSNNTVTDGLSALVKEILNSDSLNFSSNLQRSQEENWIFNTTVVNVKIYWIKSC